MYRAFVDLPLAPRPSSQPPLPTPTGEVVWLPQAIAPFRPVGQTPARPVPPRVIRRATVLLSGDALCTEDLAALDDAGLLAVEPPLSLSAVADSGLRRLPVPVRLRPACPESLLAAVVPVPDVDEEARLIPYLDDPVRSRFAGD